MAINFSKEIDFGSFVDAATTLVLSSYFKMRSTVRSFFRPCGNTVHAELRIHKIFYSCEAIVRSVILNKRNFRINANESVILCINTLIFNVFLRLMLSYYRPLAKQSNNIVYGNLTKNYNLFKSILFYKFQDLFNKIKHGFCQILNLTKHDSVPVEGWHIIGNWHRAAKNLAPALTRLKHCIFDKTVIQMIEYSIIQTQNIIFFLIFITIINPIHVLTPILLRFMNTTEILNSLIGYHAALRRSVEE
ncbi:hypothetical protein AGLY_013422 [Aphis glycines]|uniref:Uncharacterized protein n=1 Tax=Aphis glycines TaxID=307491 RepID=A0A6G0T6A2_APHGL|nr:hypothetical protein AGLY_013422 [Aphis glycines]